jgi:DNA-binding transcriptional LysR family regulator
MDVDPVRARCFLEVTERGTVVAAAAALGYTPSAVSQQVAKLERSLGTFLFDRVAGRLRPTAAAKALVPHVRHALDALEAGRLAVHAAAGAPTPAVTVTAFPSAVVNLVVPAFRDLPGTLGLVTEVEDDVGLRELSLGHADGADRRRHRGRAAPAARDPAGAGRHPRGRGGVDHRAEHLRGHPAHQ